MPRRRWQRLHALRVYQAACRGAWRAAARGSDTRSIATKRNALRGSNIPLAALSVSHLAWAVPNPVYAVSKLIVRVKTPSIILCSHLRTLHGLHEVNKRAIRTQASTASCRCRPAVRRYSWQLRWMHRLTLRAVCALRPQAMPQYRS